MFKRCSQLIKIADTMSPSSTIGLADLPPASEFYKLGLLLSVSTTVNREDLYPTFSPRPAEKFLWREAKKLDEYPTVMQATTNLLVLDHQVLAGMAIGETGIPTDRETSHEDKEGETYAVDTKNLKMVILPNPDKDSGVLGLGNCEVRPDGVDYWAKIKTNENGRGKFLCDKWVFLYIPDASHFQICQQTDNISRSRNDAHRISERLSKDGR